LKEKKGTPHGKRGGRRGMKRDGNPALRLFTISKEKRKEGEKKRKGPSATSVASVTREGKESSFAKKKKGKKEGKRRSANFNSVMVKERKGGVFLEFNCNKEEGREVRVGGGRGRGKEKSIPFKKNLHRL